MSFRTRSLQSLVLFLCLSGVLIYTFDTAHPRERCFPSCSSSYEGRLHGSLELDSMDGERALRELLTRVLGPAAAKRFHVSLEKYEAEENGYYELAVRNSTVYVTGSSPVDAAAGVGWFLKYWCNSSLSWPTTGGLQLDGSCLDNLSQFHRAAWPVRQPRLYQHSFYLNPCTLSYSMAFWDWQRWEVEIDWMAVNGINLVLAPLGQEWVWAQVLGQLGISFDELTDFFTGPAFLAWGRMGNIQGWPPPVTPDYFQKQHSLQKLLVRRMRELGITPVFPGFAGFVPQALLQHFPDLPHTRSTPWGGFPSKFSHLILLEPESEMFQRLGGMVVRQLRADFGWHGPGHYLADVWNEMRPTSSDPAFIQGISSAVYRAMAAADPGAVWVMQAWLFLDTGFWQPPQIKALLAGVPAKPHMLLLDLMAESWPQWKRTESFYGYPFVWSMLHTFGGNHGLFGDMHSVASAPIRAAKASAASGGRMAGVGITMEGIDQNPIMYDLALEMAFRSSPPDERAWVRSYAQRRYAGGGAAEVVEAWEILRGVTYNCSDRHFHMNHDIPISRPQLVPGEALGWPPAPEVWPQYDLGKVANVWQLLVQAAKRQSPGASLLGSSAFRYDLVDVGREVLSKLATLFWRQAADAFRSGNAAGVEAAGASLLQLLADLDSLLMHHQGFMLGPYLRQAREFASEPEGAEADLYEYNARLLISAWGTNAQGDSEISDYANKHWAGLMGSYYAERWRLWLHQLISCLRNGAPYDPAANRRLMAQLAQEFAHNTSAFPYLPQQEGLLSLSEALLHKYAPLAPQGQQALRRVPRARMGVATDAMFGSW